MLFRSAFAPTRPFSSPPLFPAELPSPFALADGYGYDEKEAEAQRWFLRIAEVTARISA